MKMNSQKELAEKLATACNKKSLEEVKNLLSEDGIDINFKLEGGYTALMVAINTRDNLDIVKYLCEKGADLSIASDTGWTAPTFARYCRQHKTGTYLDTILKQGNS
ncbi:ankyrin repeat domain-containing protein [Patescibacteria group bacterium]